MYRVTWMQDREEQNIWPWPPHPPGPGRGRGKQGQAKGAPGTGGNDNTKSAARKTRIPKTPKTSVQPRPPTTATATATVAATPRPEKRPKGSATAVGEVKKIPRVSVADLSVLGMSPSAATLDKKNSKGETLLHVACIKVRRRRWKLVWMTAGKRRKRRETKWGRM